MYWIHLLWYFIIISFLGWLFSSLYHFFSEKKFYDNGFLTLPFCPAYGAGAVICYVVFKPLTDNFLIIFIGSALLLSFFTVIAGFIGKKILGCKPWDYSNLKFNIGSYLTFPFVVIMGLGGVFCVKILIPMLRLGIVKIPDIVSLVVSLSIALLMLIDYVLSFVTIHRLKKRLKAAKYDVEFLNDKESAEQLKELEHNYNKIFTNTILRKRMVHAFPELKHTAYIKKITDKLDEIKEDNKKEFDQFYENKKDKPFASGFCFEKLFILFLVGSFVGTCIETIFALIVEGHFELSVGVVYGPFIPVYGGGAVLLTTVLYRLYKLSDTLIFIISAALGAFFEYICSWGQETFLGTVSWDYSDMPLNIGGRTCLLYSLFWGFLGLVWIRYIYPFASKLIEKIPKKQGSVIVVVVFIFMLYNAFVSVSSIYRWNQRAVGNPPANSFERYIDHHFDDKKMKTLFPHMRDGDTLEELQKNKPENAKTK